MELQNITVQGILFRVLRVMKHPFRGGLPRPFAKPLKICPHTTDPQLTVTPFMISASWFKILNPAHPQVKRYRGYLPNIISFLKTAHFLQSRQREWNL